MKKNWAAFIAVVVISFGVLIWQGVEIYHQQPPTPLSVVTPDGRVVLSRDDIQNGQNVWQAMGGMQLGTFWGHGSYVAPDWTADYLHRELEFILNNWAQSLHGKSFKDLSTDDQAVLLSRVKTLLRTNTYSKSADTITIDPIRVKAFEDSIDYYTGIFTNGNTDMAIPQGAQKDPAKLRQLTSFFFWGSWAASTNRPGKAYSYTMNWPHEPMVGNTPTGGLVVWTGVSVILLLGGIGFMVWYYGSQGGDKEHHEVPSKDPLATLKLTMSQKVVFFYFITVALLILVQIAMGIVTAHYAVEGGGLYGVPIDRWIPYVVTRTWHVQLGLFWIATAWLATGLFIGPVIGGKEPKGQTLGVIALLAALYLVVVGSLAGEWASVFHKFTGNWWFYFGHQGYEYVDLGRVWQIALFAGLLLWLFLVGRAIWPAFKMPGDHRPLLGLFVISLVSIGGFYGAGLMWGQKTSLPVVEYWRWWVVHLWVEGFFEVFATVAIAFLFSRMGLVNTKRAAKAALFASTVYLSGGIIGTLHHLYFSGTPVSALAFGSVFSALEVVPLVLVGFEAWENIRLSRTPGWVSQYKWPVFFFVAVAFWNMVGAGLFGFMINPPIALYYMQGLNTTPLHGHAALFGVYGMLGVGLVLFCLRVADTKTVWKDGMLKVAFWGMNGGLLGMCLLSLLPVGLFQTWASVEKGYWFARSPEFLHWPVMSFFKWMRVPGDTVFAVGAVAAVIFILVTSWKGFKKAN